MNGLWLDRPELARSKRKRTCRVAMINGFTTLNPERPIEP